jgi:hypothetical protein
LIVRLENRHPLDPDQGPLQGAFTIELANPLDQPKALSSESEKPR